MTEVEFGHRRVLPASLEAPVAALLKQTFGITSLPSCDQWFFARHAGNLVGHTALVARSVTLGAWTGSLFLLGVVAVDPSFRRQGIGASLVGQAVQWARAEGSAGVILNCGASLTRFYEAAGFRKVSDRASYLRQGGVETDDDPVLLYPLTPVHGGPWDAVFLGEDF